MPSFVPDTRNPNSLWAGVLAETLARSGVCVAVVSPGSRSAPLTMALAANSRIEAIPLLDERSAGFFALGLAKERGGPVALVCTSGSAAANYLPAVVEAHESAVPLLVFTADRPPELRACAAGQTIDQQKLYGSYVVFQHELALPELGEARLRYLRQTVAHAVARSLTAGGGPVQLNVPFRDPLAPVSDGGATAQFATTIDWERFFGHLAPPPPIVSGSAGSAITPEVHGVIVAGPALPGNPADAVAAVGEISRRLGWPVLADGASPLRFHAARVPHLVTTYDLVLRNTAVAERLQPEVVLGLGSWPASKVLRSWLEERAPLIWLAAERPDNLDGLHGRTQQLVTSLRGLAANLPAARDESGYERMWARYEAKARSLLDEQLAAESALFEPKAAWLLAQHLPAGTPLFVASSMPVRDLEYVAPPGDRAIRPFCNRGANGIDGTLSTALGIAHGSGTPTVLLTGDLAFLHDTNGLLARPMLRGSLTVVLINNRGGGIFEHLPVAHYEPPFEKFFAMPQEADLAKLCAAYGVEHVAVRDWPQFEELIKKLPTTGIRVLEIATDRKRDAAERKRCFAALAARLG